MPQRTSKILLVRLTANKKLLISDTRYEFCSSHVCFDVTRSDQNTVNERFTLSKYTYFDSFPIHTRLEASLGVVFSHGVNQVSSLDSTFF